MEGKGGRGYVTGRNLSGGRQSPVATDVEAGLGQLWPAVPGEEDKFTKSISCMVGL